jgi:hypothetical protein
MVFKVGDYALCVDNSVNSFLRKIKPLPTAHVYRITYVDVAGSVSVDNSSQLWSSRRFVKLDLFTAYDKMIYNVDTPEK